MLQVVEINAIEHLDAFRLRWTTLLYDTQGASIFHTLDWLKLYWQHFGDRQRLRVLLVHRGGTVIGMLPLVVREQATAAGAADALTYPTINASHFYGPIGPNPTATLMASFRHLSRQAREWDLLSLAGIGEHDHGRTAGALELAGFPAREDDQATVSKVCFDGVRTEHLGEVETEALEGLHDLDHESTTAGDIKFERLRPLGSLYGDEQPPEALVDECFALRRAAGDSLPAGRRNSFAESSLDKSIALLGDLAVLASRLGMLDLNLLKLDGRVIAFSFNVQSDGAIQQICVGATAKPLGFHPASLLTLRMLQDSRRRKDRCIYFAESNAGVTNPWTTRTLPVVRYQYRPVGLGSSLLLRRHFVLLGSFCRWGDRPRGNE